MDRHSLLGEAVAEITGSPIAASWPLSGGDVAASYRVALDDQRIVFAKTHADPPQHFFSTEARGLDWLRSAGGVPIPAVLGSSSDPPLLVLQWIHGAGRAALDDEAFGAGLAAIHHTGADTFGRSDRRTTGSRALPNEPCADWATFYATQRLLPLVQLAADNEVYDHAQLRAFESVADRLAAVGGPVEPPARLHGDLWAGNRIVDRHGGSWLIDPACHGGHREFDLAMMRLFGGFGDTVFDAYAEVSPLASGWEHRIALHQLAPLLVHAIKFGGGYVAAACEAAQKYQ